LPAHARGRRVVGFCVTVAVERRRHFLPEAPPSSAPCESTAGQSRAPSRGILMTRAASPRRAPGALPPTLRALRSRARALRSRARSSARHARGRLVGTS
jgi:hypothetical protein